VAATRPHRRQQLEGTASSAESVEPAPDRPDAGQGSRRVLEKRFHRCGTSIGQGCRIDAQNDWKKSKWDRLRRRQHTETQQRLRELALALSAFSAFLIELGL